MSNMSESGLAGFFAKHMVAIAATQLVGHPPRENPFFIAGIVISTGDHWFLATAGHCLERLDRAIRDTEVRDIRLVDYMGNEAVDRNPFPFDYANAPKRYFHDANGIDFGFVYLRPFYRRVLTANRIVALDEVQWKRQPEIEEYETFWMLGIPSELVDDSGRHSVLFRTAFWPVDALSGVPDQFKRDSVGLSDEDSEIHDALFYGRIDANQMLPKDQSGADDIAGMSGGPIFGFKEVKGDFKYWVVALQSYWFRDTRNIRGMPVWMGAAYLESLMESVELALESSSPSEMSQALA